MGNRTGKPVRFFPLFFPLCGCKDIQFGVIICRNAGENAYISAEKHEFHTKVRIQVPPRPPKKTAARLSLFLPVETRQNRVNPLISNENGDQGVFLFYFSPFASVRYLFYLFPSIWSAKRAVNTGEMIILPVRI